MKIVLRNKENVYEQIVNEYKRFISLKILQNDEKLPSCRQLAKDLGINPNTVAKAYSVLEQEGYIKVLPKKGVYVSYLDDFSKSVKEETKEYISSLVDKLSYEDLEKIVKEVYGRDK